MEIITKGLAFDGDFITNSSPYTLGRASGGDRDPSRDLEIEEITPHGIVTMRVGESYSNVMNWPYSPIKVT